MATDRNYGGVIWTNHALDRLSQRNLPQNLAYQAFRNPDESSPGKNPGSVEYRKRYHNSLITIIATQNERREWIILSTWIDPPLPGSIDILKKKQWQEYKNASGLKKFLILLRRQLGF
jgi:hypothetical protein